MKALGLRPVIICLAAIGLLAPGPGGAGHAADGRTESGSADGAVKEDPAKGGTAKDEARQTGSAEAGPAAATLQIDDAGIAGIGAETPFEPMEIRRHLPPGFVVIAGTYRAADEDLPTLNVLHDDAPILIVYSDGRERVSLIQILSPRIRVAQGRIGDPFATFFPEPAEAACLRGHEQLAGMAICTQPDSPRVNLLFDGSGWEGPDDAMPASTELQNWPLKYVIWSAEPLAGLRN